jgi:hypothetical protein
MLERTQERRRVLIISCGILLVAAAGAVAVVATGHPMSERSSPSPTTIAAHDSDLRTARITNNSDGKGCWQQTFDNQTGRTTRTQLPCETTVYDSSGAPVPVGTIHRLDAISKSFSGH